MKKKMKLFVWEEVLTGHTDGIMFALASDVDEARAMIVKYYDVQDYEKLIKGIEPERSTIWDELQKEPKVFDSPVGFVLFGGG